MFKFLFALMTFSCLASTPTNTFSSGTPILASEVNTNFAEIYQKVPVKAMVIRTTGVISATGTETNLQTGDHALDYVDAGSITESAPATSYTAAATGLYRFSGFVDTLGAMVEVRLYVNATQRGIITGSTKLVAITAGQAIEFKIFDGSPTNNINIGSYILVERIQ